MGPPRVVLAAASRALADGIASCLEGAIPVELETTARQRGHDGAVVLTDAPTGPSARTIVLAAGGDADLGALFAAGYRHVLGVGRDGSFDTRWLRAAVLSLALGARPHEHGPRAARIGSALGETATFRVASTAERRPVVERVEAFAQEHGAASRLAEALGSIADELVTNALYDAPVDGRGAPRFAHLARSEPVGLDGDEHVEIALARDEDRIEIGVSDPFGALRAEHVLGHLARCLARGKDQVANKEGGAGLGLYTVFKLANTLVVSVVPGRRTHVLASLVHSRSYAAAARGARSLFVFEAG